MGFFTVENLKVYERLCDLHIEICEVARQWPIEERFELASQVRRSYRDGYEECVRMLNGLEASHERQLPESEKRWPGQPF
jgi:hypothetical protein